MSNRILTNWKLPLSQKPRVTLFLQSNGAGYVVWTNAKGTGKEELSTLLSPFENGILVPERMAQLVHVAAAMAATVAIDKSTGAVATARDQAIEAYGAPMTSPAAPSSGWDFGEGVNRYFTAGATASAAQQADERKAVEDLIKLLTTHCHLKLWSQLRWPDVQSALKKWAELTHKRYMLDMAGVKRDSTAGASALKENASRSGLPELRKAVRAANVLVRISGWLHEHEPSSGAVPVRVKNASKIVRGIWQAKFEATGPSEQPRHSPAEFAMIVNALHDPNFAMDPRLRLALLINLERRAGQVLHVRRSYLRITDERKIACRIPGRGTKSTAALYFLVPKAADALLEAMNTGYLAEFEAAYRAGKIKDYWIFPKGKLAKGIAKFTEEKITGSSWNERSLSEEFDDLEARCGVESVPGRGFYGLKRAATDILDHLEDDEEMKNAFFSHATTDVRLLYLDILPRMVRQAKKMAAFQERLREIAASVDLNALRAEAGG